MARIKIFQVQGSPRTPGTPDVSGALVPLSAATQFGKGISSFGKAVEAVALENKAEEDANEAADIITGVNNKITDIYGNIKEALNLLMSSIRKRSWWNRSWGSNKQ